MNLNTELYDNLIHRAAMLRLFERRVSGKVDIVLNDHTDRLDKIIRNSDLTVVGQRKLKERIDIESTGSFRQAFNVSKSSLLDLVADQLSFTYQKVEAKVGKIWRTERPAKRVSEEIVLQNPLYSNQTLAQGWAGISKSERIRLDLIIRKGIADGLSIDEIAVLVRKGHLHDITRNQSRALVTTAATSVVAQADHQIYKANEKALQGYQYIAVLDARTTPLCAHRDGHVYPISDTEHLPPAHWRCRSTTVPVFKSWSDIASLENIAQVRRENISNLTEKQKAYYDGMTPLKESYNDWLLRQPKDIQLAHLGDYNKVELFNKNQLTVDQFTNPEGNTLGIRELRQLTDSTYALPNDTQKFANAKAKLDAMQLYASTPDSFINDKKLTQTLLDYYLLQSGELDGTLSLTNYRGTLIHTKKATKNRVLNTLPTEDQMIFNPMTGRYEDSRMYQPSIGALSNNLRLVEESTDLKDKDKLFINSFERSLSEKMSVNERAVVVDNLRNIFSRFRRNGEVWGNFKAVSQSQIKFDVMNVSDTIETQIRKDSDPLKKLLQDNYIDPVLGPVQLQKLHDTFHDNIRFMNKWEDKVAPKIARELRGFFDLAIPFKIRDRLTEVNIQKFYLKLAKRLALADTPDRDQLAVTIGRDLYNAANFNGTRKDWYNVGLEIINANNSIFKVETFGVQKRRMKSRLSGQYFGPYYDTLAYNIRITDPRIQEYAQTVRKVDLGLRVSVVNDDNRLIFKEGYKTYFMKSKFGLEDTRIPITSTSSFSDFPEDFVDENMKDALEWASKARYRIDGDFYDFTQKLLYFVDDRGNAKKYDALNEYKHYISSRGDAYERFKAMEWLRKSNDSFSNHPFIDHRARIYDRGLISPQSGESFRPYLNTEIEKPLGEDGFKNFKDQIGAFMGGLNDVFEGRYNSLSFTGRQKIADKLWPEMVDIGNKMLRAKPADIRFILESEMVQSVEGEELGKFFRFAIEAAKLDNHIKSGGTLDKYMTALALEQDASSSGAQIIALTTKNKQLAELSNVVPTNQKRRLYDEIAASTYNDPRFKVMNERLGLSEKDLRKAAKAQNMVTFYGAGERTGILNVEGKLAKILDKTDSTLVVKASDRDKVLSEISARAARYQRFDEETYNELMVLRANVKDIFNKGLEPGDEIMEQLYFLEPKTKELVEKMTASYDMVVTPKDFQAIAKIMSEHLAEQVPILKDFTKYFGRLAEDFLTTAKPSGSDLDWKVIGKIPFLGTRQKTIGSELVAGSRERSPTIDSLVLGNLDKKLKAKFNSRLSEILGIKADEPITEKILKRFTWYRPDGILSDLLYGVHTPDDRTIGKNVIRFKYTFINDKFSITQPLKIYRAIDVSILFNPKMPKKWTNVPWVNFDGKTLEQNFTQSFEERLNYKDKDGNWVTNILQVPQKTSSTGWEEWANDPGNINDIADATKARTAYAVNGNHSNDATLVKNFHLWGRDNNIATSTIHDAFFANAADMLIARKGLRELYANALNAGSVVKTLDEMKARGLPQELYDAYLKEGIEKGIIPVAGKSVVGGKVLTENDILKIDDILAPIPDPSKFSNDVGFYGVG
jgi:SPP1 gp7 family putative phage head morphogenesis protein